MTKTEDQRPKTGKFIWITLAIIVVAVYFFGLTIPLLGPDEPRYSQVAREMFERGDFITPKLGGFDWFEKPALLYWLQIVSYKLFGVSEFAARFGSAIFGLGTIFCLWILGKSVSSLKSQVSSEEDGDKGQSEKSDFANWLALIAASSIGLLVFSRGASFDIILTFPLTASLVAYFIFDLTQRREGAKAQRFYLLPSVLYLFAFYFFIGIALIAKGLIGIVFPFAIVAFYLLLSWKLPSRTLIFSLFWGTIVALLVASIWYLPMYQANGWKFVDEFFIQHHFQRYLSNKYQHPQPFWFFLLVLPLMTIPWLPFFFAAIWDFLKVQSSKSEIEGWKKLLSPPFFSSSSPLLLFSVAWLLVPLVFFSLSGSKLPGYILPALPAALVLTADYVYKFVQKSKFRVVALQTLAFLTFAVVAVLLQFVVPRFADADSVKGLMEIADAQGLTNEKVLNLHTTSHNAEFYFAGRLVRAEDGKLKKFLGIEEVLDEIKRENGADVLVLVPLEYLNVLMESDSLEARVLGDNGDLAIVSVRSK